MTHPPRTRIDRALDRWGRTGNFVTTVLVAIAKQIRRKPRDPALQAAAAQGRADALADAEAGMPGASYDGSDDGMTDEEAETYSRAYIAAAPKEWFPRPRRGLARRTAVDPRWRSQLVQARNEIDRWTVARDRIIGQAAEAGRPMDAIAEAADLPQSVTAAIATRWTNCGRR